MRRNVVRLRSLSAPLCLLCVLLFSHPGAAQTTPPPSNPVEAQISRDSSPPGRDASVLLEYVKFLREEEKLHREYLEKLYTITIIVLGALGTIGTALISFFQYKTRADVQQAVNSQFEKTVSVEWQNRVEQFDKVRAQWQSRMQQSMDELKQDVTQRGEAVFADMNKRFEDMLLAAARDRVEGAGQTKAAPETTAAPTLNDQEKAIMKVMDSDKYSFRSFIGVTSEAQQDAEAVAQLLDELVKKGLLGKTLGKTGGERWFITPEGRRHLISQPT
jgi:hypothetical protein